MAEDKMTYKISITIGALLSITPRPRPFRRDISWQPTVSRVLVNEPFGIQRLYIEPWHSSKGRVVVGGYPLER